MCTCRYLTYTHAAFACVCVGIYMYVNTVCAYKSTVRAYKCMHTCLLVLVCGFVYMCSEENNFLECLAPN